MKMCEQIFKKRQRPNTIQILWIVKKGEPLNNNRLRLTAAINHLFRYFFVIHLIKISTYLLNNFC